ncbi:MAG: histidine phosphatase family protein [Lachnospiraceae bacterium]|nr:histidine phosphatase family protein [Lachnospiraceae bacterium]MBQ8547583.1 histidine phosphatase family protein [Lachnospiraceae bacterium]MBQ8847305.1 histidine phosphatase family protein [Lachnospiraceae bacterium]
MRLILIRHGRQSSPLCNVDVDLSEVGRRQAELLAGRLTGLYPDRIYTSGLIRAKQTAEILFGKDVRFYEREALNEISFGDMTGGADSQNAVLFPEYFAAKKKKADNLRMPGGECPTEVFERAVKVVNEAIEIDAETVVFVTHGGVIRALVAGLLGLGAGQMLRIADSLEHTSVTELRYSEEAECFSLERLNDASHLEGRPELSRNAWSKG